MKVKIRTLFQYLLETTEAAPEAIVGFSLSASPNLGDYLADLDPNQSLDWNGRDFRGLPELRDHVLAQAGRTGICRPADVLITAGAAEANYLSIMQLLQPGDNLGAFRTWFGVQPNTKVATLIFGFLHGFGLASKILDYGISPDGLVPNLLAFNVGVEIGQLLALMAILLVMTRWRTSPSFARQAYAANVLMMTAGFALMGYQLVGLAAA